jgi:hypothetical protein
MSNFKLKFNELKRDIEAMTQQILDDITKSEFGNIENLLMRRYDLLTELISLVASADDRLVLMTYISDFQHRDQDLMDRVSKERSLIGDTLANLNSLNQYINV